MKPTVDQLCALATYAPAEGVLTAADLYMAAVAVATGEARNGD